MSRHLYILLAFSMLFTTTYAEGETEAELATAAQNPLASMISLPFQNNTTFGGMGGDYINSLNIQPVYPVSLSEDWNLITRPVLPVLSMPVNGDQQFGLGDTTFTGWFSPTAPVNNITWGVGPVAYLPTATRTALGTDQWGGGLSAVGVWIDGPWVAGALANNVWGFENSGRLNNFLFQYFVNYNLDAGWYLVSAPIMTANWNASSSNRWTVPLGGGVGKIFKVGKQPMNLNGQFYYNIIKPDNYGHWTFRLQLQFMFPK
ncbi:neuromedin U [Planctomycetota bacterium]